MYTYVNSAVEVADQKRSALYNPNEALKVQVTIIVLTFFVSL